MTLTEDALTPRVCSLRFLKTKARSNRPWKAKKRAESDRLASCPLLALSQKLPEDPCFICAGIAHVGTIYAQTQLADVTWGCGYRNIQNVLSALLACDPVAYEHAFHSASILTIKQIQMGIEQAWKNGYDVEGAAQLGWKLEGRQKWIGTTEAYAFFTNCGYDCTILQFAGEHRVQRVFGFCEQYFGLRDSKQNSDIICSSKIPLYFQHQGHSRTIVGAAQTPGESRLLLFDPAKKYSTRNKTAWQEGAGAKVPISKFKSLMLSAHELKHKEYQVLLFGERFLTEDQKAQRKDIRPRNM